MARAARRAAIGLGWAALAALGSGCADPAPGGGGGEAGLRLEYADVLAPTAYSFEGPARAEPEGAAAGFWAVAPGLLRPERGRVENLATGASLDLPLFAGSAAGPLRLSPAAAEALGLAAAPGRARATALRREPRIAAP